MKGVQRIKSDILKTLMVCIFSILILAGADTANADNIITENRPVYNVESVSPFMTYFKHQNESINMDTGSLTLTVTDLSLPGRGGLDLNLTRTYSSNQANLYEMMANVYSGVWVRQYTHHTEWVPIEDVPDYLFYIDAHTHWYTVPEQPISPDGMVAVYLDAHLHYLYNWYGEFIGTSWSGGYLWGYDYYNSFYSYTETHYASQTSDTTYLDKKYGIGVGWSFNFPSVQTSSEAKYLHTGNGTVYKIYQGNENLWVSNLENYYLKDLYYNKSGGSFTYAGTNYSYASALETKDGINYHFDSNGDLIAIRDRFGDTILFSYTTFNGKQVISRITDTVGRQINFSYTTTKVTVTTSDKMIEYNLVLIEGSKYKLTSVVYKNIGGAEPGDRTVSYAYTLDNATFDLYYSDATSHTPATNKYLNLTTVTHISGATTKYEYAPVSKNVDRDDSSNLGTMTQYRVTKRYDTANSKDYNIYAFSYDLMDGSRTYNQKSQVVAGWDTQSQAKPLTEKYFFEDYLPMGGEKKIRLLKEKRSEGSGFKEIEITGYSVETQMPYSKEVQRFDPAGNQSESTTRKFAYDLYRNLLYEVLTYKDGSLDKVLSETFNTYDTGHYHTLTNSISAVDGTKAVKVENTLDGSGLGRVVQETKGLYQKTTLSQPTTQNAPGLPRNMFVTGEFWNWVTPIKIDSFDIVVSWFAAGPWQFVNYSIWARAYDSDTWIDLQDVNHQAGILSLSGTDTYTFNLSAYGLAPNKFYELKVTANLIGAFGSRVSVESVSITSNTTDQFSEIPGESVITKFEYDPAYQTNIVKKSVGTMNGSTFVPDIDINMEYDDQYHAYLKRQYVNNVTNPYFGTTGETVQVEYLYDFFGRTISSKEGLGHETTYNYDNLDRPTREYHAVDLTEKTISYYDSLSQVIVIDEDGVASIFIYDQLGRPVSTYGDLDSIHDNGNEVKLSEKVYNSLGRLWQEIDAENHIKYYYYDAAGRIIEVRYPDGTSQTISYNDLLRQKIVTDANGHQTLYKMDRLGNVIQIYVEA